MKFNIRDFQTFSYTNIDQIHSVSYPEEYLTPQEMPVKAIDIVQYKLLLFLKNDAPKI